MNELPWFFWAMLGVFGVWLVVAFVVNARSTLDALDGLIEAYKEDEDEA